MSNDSITIAIQFSGGLGLFLFGMHVLAAGLQKSAGSKMKSLLEALTKNKFMGVLVGLFVTGIIQSSSATTVMVVGFVNAGLMNLAQSVGVIMGANIGTTVTSWIVASIEWAKFLKPDYFAPLIVAVGAGMVLFARKVKVQQIGEIVVGFGVLFMGMSFMTNALKPLSGSAVFRNLLLELGGNPLLGLLAGAVVTAVIQSSSASVGILQALALEGLVPFSAAVYIIMGQNIGTCITALLSSIGSSRSAKSAAYIHLLFNVIGSVVFGAAAVVYFYLINPALGASTISITQISLVHTSFNVANTVLLYWFSDTLIAIAQRMAGTAGEGESSALAVHLDDRILQNPSFALQNCVKEIVRLGDMAAENLRMATESIFDRDGVKITKVLSQEKDIDELTNAISGYLVKICNSDIGQDGKNYATALFHTINDIERVGDHCENLVELATFMEEDHIEFSDAALGELRDFSGVVASCYGHAINAFANGDKDLAEKAAREEAYIDGLEREMRAAHIERLTNNQCNSVSGVVFLDALTNLERVSDHAQNIAQLVLGTRGETRRD